MKKSFKIYALAWAILLVVFNVIAIVAPGWESLDKTTPSFWIGYSFITAAMIGQLVCAWMAFKSENLQKTFLGISLFTVSYSALMANFAVGAICMIISPLPYWVGAIVCPLVLALGMIATLKAKVAIDLAGEVEEKVDAATLFIKLARAESETLLAQAKGEEAQEACKKVRDALKYSDPMSASALTSVENEIQARLDALSAAVAAEEQAEIATASQALLDLIAKRNTLCKVLK